MAEKNNLEKELETNENDSSSNDSTAETETPKTIKTALRTSIVLGKNGGAFIP